MWGPKALACLDIPWSNGTKRGSGPLIFTREDRDDAINFCKASSAAQADYEFEYRMIASDGRAVWIHDLVNVVADGAVPKLLQGFMIDITERKKAEQSARASEKSALETLAELDQLYRTAPVGLCLMDCDLRFRPYQRALGGYQRQTCRGAYRPRDSRSFTGNLPHGGTRLSASYRYR